MTEYSATDMQVAVSRIAAANMSQAPYPLTTEQWAALRSAPATIERLKEDLATSRETHADAVGVIAGLRAEAEQMHAQIQRLQSLCSSVGTGRPFFPGPG